MTVNKFIELVKKLSDYTPSYFDINGNVPPSIYDEREDKAENEAYGKAFQKAIEIYSLLDIEKDTNDS